jgi:uncharacterized protein YdeI (YjbR/CyaY-like superfamily)
VPSQQPELIVTNAAAWRAWLRKNHGDPVGVWLVIAKKGTVEPTSLNYDQALEEALCHGWIDGQAKPRDDATYKQRFTQRRKRSAWSKRNVGKAERLLVDGRMHPAGVAEIERAKADGRWEAAYPGASSIEVPADFSAALATDRDAQAMFDVLTKSEPLRDPLPPHDRETCGDARASPRGIRRDALPGRSALPAEANAGRLIVADAHSYDYPLTLLLTTLP